MMASPPSPAAAETPPAYERRIVAPGEVLALGDGALETALDGGLVRPQAEPLKAPAAGIHWLAVTARDAAGQLAAPRWLRLEVDSVPPAVELALTPPPLPAADGGAPWLGRGGEAVAHASDALAGVATLEIVIPAGAVAGTVGSSGAGAGAEARAPITAPVADNGAVTIEARATDRVGNRGQATLTVRVDTEPPTVAPRFAGPQTVTDAGWVIAPQTRLTADVTDAGSGGAGSTVAADGRPAAADTGGEPWMPGPHRATLEAWDHAGNRAKSPEIAFTVDDTPPELTLEVTSPHARAADGREAYTFPVTVRVAATDALAGIGSLDKEEEGRGWTPARREITTHAPRLRIRAVDRVGNTTLRELDLSAGLAPTPQAQEVKP
jgi:hypothetical protein